MRIFTVALLIAVLLGAGAASAHAARLAPEGPRLAVSAQQDAPRHVDDNDDTRVEVQLVMLAVAAFTVLGIGAAGFLLRKKLGLVAGPPEQPAGHH